MSKGPLDKRIQRFVGKRARNAAKGWDYCDAPDPRQRKKVRHPMSAILWALELGLLSNQVTLRDVEALLQRFRFWCRLCAVAILFNRRRKSLTASSSPTHPSCQPSCACPCD